MAASPAQHQARPGARLDYEATGPGLSDVDHAVTAALQASEVEGFKAEYERLTDRHEKLTVDMARTNEEMERIRYRFYKYMAEQKLTQLEGSNFRVTALESGSHQDFAQGKVVAWFLKCRPFRQPANPADALPPSL